ncbi:MAG TPA: hypothetical protein ENI05_13440, partial [Porticoccus sp.]|nr:hypothetical protein [Porticoccus sp.]
MGFPIVIPDAEVDYLSPMQFSSDCYLLVWKQNIVFQARVNQASFANTWTVMNYDNSVGLYIDALIGHTVWISPTSDIRDYTWWGRIRSNTTTSAFTLEWNSYQPNDNDYIFVTKDIRVSAKTPRKSGPLWLADWGNMYRHPSPIIGGVPTYMFGVLDEDGNAEITLAPSAQAIYPGATIAGWALDTDGGTEVSFDSGTGAAVIRYVTPGDYMPRLTVTDSNAQTQWFSPFVTIDDAEMSSAIKLKFDRVSIGANLNNGWNMTMPFLTSSNAVGLSTS